MLSETDSLRSSEDGKETGDLWADITNSLFPLKMLSSAPWEAPGAAMFRHSSMWLRSLAHVSRSSVAHHAPSRGWREEGKKEASMVLGKLHEVFGVLQIRPTRGCKIAGAFFCCGEATVRSYSSSELNCVCALHWLSPALPGMLSTSLPSVQHNSRHPLWCWARFCFILLDVHTEECLHCWVDTPGMRLHLGHASSWPHGHQISRVASKTLKISMTETTFSNPWSPND